jgi:hypothetical protein
MTGLSQKAKTRYNAGASSLTWMIRLDDESDVSFHKGLTPSSATPNGRTSSGKDVNGKAERS